MKKLMVFIFVILSAGVCIAVPKADVFGMANAKSYTLILNVEEAKAENLTFTQNGQDAIFSTADKSQAHQLYKKYNPKCAILTFDKGEYNNILNYLKIDAKSTQKVENMQILCAYTSIYPEYRVVENKKVNVQMAIKEEEIICGFPMIMTGF